jgi:hypothetical protein|tara:strand:+ start:233 stop:406 length:174 start_codon:yes stop_codon:yes gene_type:complete
MMPFGGWKFIFYVGLKDKFMSLRKSKSRGELMSQAREAAYIFIFPVLMLIWAVQSYV